MPKSKELTSSGLLAKNSALNLIGSAAPMVVAFLTIPLLFRGLGADRFGVLVIAWTTVGYFSLFDLGLGRALTQLVAERLGSGREEEIPTLTWSALALMLGVGIVGALALAAASPWLVLHALKVPPSLQAESLVGFYLLAGAVPFVITTAALRGILEANQNFGLINAIRIPMGILSYAVPLAVLPFSRHLAPVIGALVVSRILAWAAHLAFCLRALPILRSDIRIDRSVLGPLTRFGGWMTMSNLASSLMVYLDRFMIGGVVSMAAVAFYVTPYDAITKLWLIPGAFVGVLYPALAVSYANDRSHTQLLVDRAFRAVFQVLFPIVLLVVAFAHEGLLFWMEDPEFASHSMRVLQLLAAGVLVNSLGMIPAAGLQGVGRPDLTGKLNLMELPLYLGVLWWLLQTHGIEGAAMAWLLRVVVDTIVLSILADRVIQGRVLTRHLVVWLLPAGLALAAVALPGGTGQREALVAGVLLVFLVAAWNIGITPVERAAIGQRLFRHRQVVVGDGPRLAPPDAGH